MIPGIENTPPEVAVALGFFIGISLRQGRLSAILDKLLPVTRGSDTTPTDDDDEA